MEARDLFRVLFRWSWLIVTVMIVTVGATYYRLQQNPVYEAQVTIELTAPQEENVALFNRFGSIALRDEMQAARNNLTEVLKSQVIADRTAATLGLKPNQAAYSLGVNPSRDADFTYVVVDAVSPELAAKIANTHVAAAVDYYGELRAKPAVASRDFIAEKLRSVQQELAAARAAEAQFQADNSVANVDATANNQQQLINNSIEQSQNVLNQMTLDRQRAQTDQQAIIQRNTIQQTENLLAQLKLAREEAFAQGGDTVQTVTLTDKILSYDQAIAKYTADLETLRTATPVNKQIQATSDLLFQLKLDRERLAIQGDNAAQKISALDQTIASYAVFNDNMKRTNQNSEAAKLTAGLLDELRAERQSLVTNGDQPVKDRMARIDATIASYTTKLESLNGAVPTSDAINTDTKLIQQLKAERARLASQGSGSKDATAKYDDAIARYTAEVDRLKNSPLTFSAPPEMANSIANQKAELQRVLALGPQFSQIEDRITNSSAQYTLLQQKYTEAVLTAEVARAASYIQIVEPAVPPGEPSVQKQKIFLALAALGGMGVGVLLAFLLESLMRALRSQPARSYSAALMTTTDRPLASSGNDQRGPAYNPLRVAFPGLPGSRGTQSSNPTTNESG